jgi:hypothetical protein
MTKQCGSKVDETAQRSAGGPDRDPRVAARRKFLTAGLATVPVIVTLASRPAFADCTSDSAKLSGNQSRCPGIR